MSLTFGEGRPRELGGLSLTCCSAQLKQKLYSYQSEEPEVFWGLDNLPTDPHDQEKAVGILWGSLELGSKRSEFCRRLACRSGGGTSMLGRQTTTFPASRSYCWWITWSSDPGKTNLYRTDKPTQRKRKVPTAGSWPWSCWSGSRALTLEWQPVHPMCTSFVFKSAGRWISLKKEKRASLVKTWLRNSW